MGLVPGTLFVGLGFAGEIRLVYNDPLALPLEEEGQVGTVESSGVSCAQRLVCCKSV